MMLMRANIVAKQESSLKKSKYTTQKTKQKPRQPEVFVLGSGEKEDIFCCGVYVLVFLRKCGIMRVVNVWSGVWLSKSKS